MLNECEEGLNRRNVKQKDEEIENFLRTVTKILKLYDRGSVAQSHMDVMLSKFRSKIAYCRRTINCFSNENSKRSKSCRNIISIISAQKRK